MSTSLGPPSAGARLGTLAETVVPGSRSIVIAASKDDNPKVTLLLIPPGAARPTVAVKVATTPGSASSVLREAQVLRSLDRTGLGAVARTVPTVLQVIEHEGLPAMVCDVLEGTPLLVDYHAWRHTARPARVRRDFDLAREWLASLPLTRPGSTLPGQPWSVRLAGRWAGDPEVAGVLESLRAAESRLSAPSLPTTLVHGDFWCGNILATGRQVTGVVDWEAAEQQGSPLRDWVRFALSYSLYLDRHTRPGRAVPGHPGLRAGDWGAGVHWALTGHGWYPDLVRDFLTEAVVRLGLPATCWRDAVVLGLTEVAATADHPDFARSHLHALAELLSTWAVAS